MGVEGVELVVCCLESLKKDSKTWQLCYNTNNHRSSRTLHLKINTICHCMHMHAMLQVEYNYKQLLSLGIISVAMYVP